MLTVPEAAERSGRNPETIRRWIRAGRLRSTKVGTQHLIQGSDLDAVTAENAEMLPLPTVLQHTAGGSQMPNLVALLNDGRRGR